MKRFLRVIAALIAVVTLPVIAQAQSRGTITGQVVDAATNQPLVGASVTVPGTALGTLTNTQGQFTIANAPAGSVELRANRIGYAQATETVTVAAGGTASASFALTPTAVALDELVVTGTAGTVSRRSQPASISTLNAGEITEKAPVSSVQDLLTSRVPGVQLTASSGSSGTSQQIRIRGASSISLSNEPLIFIDGVRADSRSQSDISGGGIWVGGQGSSRLFDINPEDIQTVEVVKGPAAATMYGADASAGVIHIITKRGTTGANQFRQNLTLEYHDIDPNFTPETAYGRCSQALVDIANSLCGGKEVGSVFGYNALQDKNAFRNGQLRSINYNARGGGENYGYYVSFGQDDEQGTLRTNDMLRRTARGNFNFTPNPRVSLNAGVGIADVTTNLPMNDNNVYGYMGVAYLGNPANARVQEDGSIRGGTYANRPFEAVDAIESESNAIRVTPTIQAEYTPLEWFRNRLVVGADLTRGELAQYFPLNSNTWYQGDANLGDLTEQRSNNDILTVDYQGTITRDLTDALTSTLTFGTQYIRERLDVVSANGIGFVTTGNRVVGDAAQISATQDYSDTRQLGFLGQLDLSYQERLYLQLGARVDQFSSFGENADKFFLPRVGVSYVISEEPFWDGLASAIPSLRLRAAYGTTGRSPTAGAALETYSARPYAILAGTGSAAGVVPLNPGNFDLKPEKGTEFEGGADIGLFNNRMGVELTYYNKTTTDLLLRRPVPPSTGASSNPFVNIGEVKNSGLEFAVNGTLLDRRNLRWEARVAGSTLDNELVDLGDIEPFGTAPRFEEGHQLGFFSTRLIREVITQSGDSRCPDGQPCVIVSDANEYFANSLPTYEGNFSTTFTLFENLQLDALLDWKGGHAIYNNTAQFRERSFGTAEIAVRRDEVATQEELLRRYGPFVAENGSDVSYTNVNVEYFEPADFVRLRELSASYSLPERFASRFGASRAWLTVGARNLKLWTDYSGPDPEVLSAATEAAGNASFAREDFLTVPQPRRLLVRMNLSF